MPVSTFCICTLSPFLMKTTRCSFSRCSRAFCFSSVSFVTSARLSLVLARAVARVCFSRSSGESLLSVAADGDALDRHGDGVLHRVRLDVGGRAHAGAQPHGVVGDA